MIQRKQTIFLLLAVIACVCCLFLPIAGFEPKGMGTEVALYNLGVVDANDGIRVEGTCIPFCLLLSVSTILSAVAIFLFKNRSLQNGLCSIALLFTVLWVVDYILFFLGVVAIPGVEGKFEVHFAACLPIVAIVLLTMAKKGINDDEKLVRAADRIR